MLLLFFQSVQLSLLPVNLSLLRLDLLLHSRILVLPLLHLIPDHGAAKETMDNIEARLETACRANPKEYFAEAMVSVVQQLNPERVKTESAK